MSKKKLSEVFQTVGLPPYTYVKPSHYGEIRSDIEQQGKHLLIEGPSGIGKTCVVFKVFEELNLKEDEDYQYISCRDDDVLEKIGKIFGTNKDTSIERNFIVFLDDFHILDESYRNDLGDRLKSLSDEVFTKNHTLKFILVGIPAAGSSVLAKAGDLGPRIGVYRFSTASDGEINLLINEGEVALNIIFEDRDIILSEAAGNFWLAQYICNKICSIRNVHLTSDQTQILTFDLLNIRARILAELATRFMDTAVAFSKGKKWRPGGNKPYLELLLALAKTPESVVSFDQLLGLVPDRRRPGIKAVKSRISHVIFNPEDGIDLRKQIAFEDPSFSIEDPLFRYFLSHLSEDSLYRELGLSKEAVARDSVYAYDIAFSFSGSVRPIVETLNDELKSQDVITFYDYDQQSALLGDDLESVLKSIYSTSAKYYAVFIDDTYADKIWTKYEKDIMTHSTRSRHIIPIILTENGRMGLAGISSTIAHIDLTESWAGYLHSGHFNEDAIITIKNRAVLPVIEKVDEFVP